MVSFKQLNYALAVAETRHFKRAAEQCGVSQSALSTAISELENQLGIQIFERDNKKVLISPIGERILDKARSIKLEVDDLYIISQGQQAPLSYPLSIGVIPTIGPYLLPKTLPEVRKQYPDLKLRIVEEQSSVLVDKVRSGELDTAILALPYAVDGLLALEFWKEDFYLVTHNSGDLAKLKEVKSDQLDEGHLLLLKDGHCLKDHVLAACKLQATQTDHSLEGASLYTLIQMVASQMGTTMVPQMALDQLVLQSNELKAIHLAEPGPHRKLAFITRLNYAGVANIELLIKLFQKQLTRYCAA
ncbi:MAG: hydrogen peroxide-inducible genes activator [Sneathiella sp.]|nr:hydrogen peroxide-inducible genes activator [Sneathiella sp.]